MHSVYVTALSAIFACFRERQRQLDELTKELTRVNDETELLKSKLRALAKQVT